MDSYSRRLTETDGRGQTTSYGYDDLDRVTSVAFHGGSTVSYGYDANGNQTSRTATPAGGGTTATTTYTYDALNRLTAEAKPTPGATVSFSYDPVGNLRFHTGPGGVVEYRYSAVNLLAALVQPGGATTTYGYDNDNNRTGTTHPNGVVVTSAYNAAGNVTAITAVKGASVYVNLAYEYRRPGSAVDDIPLRSAVTDQVSGERTAYTYDPDYDQLTDALGSVIALTDAAGTKTDTFSYDPYGVDAGRTGTTENPYRFTGEHRDPSGQYKIGQRYYTPELGRWTQPDPTGQDDNYTYAVNNPINYIDPDGELAILAPLVLLGIRYAVTRYGASAVQGAATRHLAYNTARKAALDRSLQRATRKQSIWMNKKSDVRLGSSKRKGSNVREPALRIDPGKFHLFLRGKPF